MLLVATQLDEREVLSELPLHQLPDLFDAVVLRLVGDVPNDPDLPPGTLCFELLRSMRRSVVYEEGMLFVGVPFDKLLHKLSHGGTIDVLCGH